MALSATVASTVGAASGRSSGSGMANVPASAPSSGVSGAANRASVPKLYRVDSDLDGRDPLALSLRNPRIDMASPLNFDDLYAVEGRNDIFVRRSGAVYAVFPRSLYVKKAKGGERSVVPAGTTYSFGFPCGLLAPRENDAPSSPAAVTDRIELREDADASGPSLVPRLTHRLDLSAGRPEPSTSSAPREAAWPSSAGSPSAGTHASGDATDPVRGDASGGVSSTSSTSAWQATDRATSEAMPKFVADESYRRGRLGSLLRSVTAP